MTNKTFTIKSLFRKEGDIVFCTPEYYTMKRAVCPSLWGFAEDVTILCDYSRTSLYLLAELSADIIQWERDKESTNGKITVKFPNGKTVELA